MSLSYCPHCHKDIEEFIYDSWSGDYWMYMDDFTCPLCDMDLDIEVEMEPYFITKKSEKP